MRTAVALGLVAVSACGNDHERVAADPQVTFLTPTEHLTRASLALRGVRPSLDDLRAVDNDPGALPGIVDRYLATPEFGATIRELHNESLLLEIEVPTFTPLPAGAVASKTFTEIASSIFDEPLRLIEDVVMTDRPYTDIVTADYTMADTTVATMWGLPHGPQDAWERTVRTDGRGNAGILASDALYIRYRSAAFNYNRDRANAISRALLCHNFLDGKIELDTSVNLADPAVVANAVRTNPSCAGCHQVLDPLASYFFGFYRGVLPGFTAYPQELYNPVDDQTGSPNTDPSAQGPATDPVGGTVDVGPSAAEADLLRRYTQASADRARATRGALGYNRRRVDDFVEAIDRGDRLRALGGFGQRGEATSLAAQIQIALDALEQDVSHAVMLNTREPWDTHADNYLQADCNEVTFAGLIALLDGLSSRPGRQAGTKMIDDTVVAVISEMGRTPRAAGDAPHQGKGHWPLTGELVIGAGVAGGSVFGATTPDMQAVLVDLATGAPMTAGTQPMYSHFVAGLLALCGVDPASHLDVPPYHAFVAG